MGFKDGFAICETCGNRAPADEIPRGWIIITSGRLKEQCIKLHVSYGNREDGTQSYLESFTRTTGTWCGIGCLEHFIRTGSPRGFGSISRLVETHKRGRPKQIWKRTGIRLVLKRGRKPWRKRNGTIGLHSNRAG